MKYGIQFGAMKLLLLLFVNLLSQVALADDRDELQLLLNEFLANVDSVAMHDRFWADELVYTSSNGTRTDKDSILESMRAPQEAATDETAIRYSARDVDIRVYGQMAVVAFRLHAQTGGTAEEKMDYLNTGTFQKRAGAWQAVAWQATRMAEEATDNTVSDD
jgi:hypothetical protein